MTTPDPAAIARGLSENEKIFLCRPLLLGKICFISPTAAKSLRAKGIFKRVYGSDKVNEITTLGVAVRDCLKGQANDPS